MCIYIHDISTYFLIVGIFSGVVLAPSVDFIALCYLQRVPTPWRTQPMGKAPGSRWTWIQWDVNILRLGAEGIHQPSTQAWDSYLEIQ